MNKVNQSVEPIIQGEVSSETQTMQFVSIALETRDQTADSLFFFISLQKTRHDKYTHMLASVFEGPPVQQCARSIRDPMGLNVVYSALDQCGQRRRYRL